MSQRARAAALAAAIAVVAFAFVRPDSSSAQTPQLAYRVAIAFVAREELPANAADLPPADAAYCPGAGGGTAPPNSVIGALTVGGQPALPGTLVQLVLDGKAGPAARVRNAGGYRIDYSAGGAACSNRVGAPISIFVHGQEVSSNVRVGDEAANPFLRFDINLP
jgi:hypothetical protein